MPTKAGPSQREALLKIWKATGKKPKPLEDLPELPEVMVPLYEKYQQMKTGKLAFDTTASWTDIHHWQLVTGITNTKLELQILLILDGTFVSEVNTQRMRMQN